MLATIVQRFTSFNVYLYSTAMEPQDLEMPDFNEYTPEVRGLFKCSM